jgi:hypothetical protein
VPKAPVINVGPTAGQFQPQMAVRIYPPPITGTPDPRNDARLKEALQALHLLSRPDPAAAETQPATKPGGSKLSFRVAVTQETSHPMVPRATLTEYRELLQGGKVGLATKEGLVDGKEPAYIWLPVGDEVQTTRLVTGEYKGQTYLLVSDKADEAMLPGEGEEAWGLKRVADNDAMGKPAIRVTLDERGAKRFAALTKASIGKNLAMIVDEKVISAPRVMAEISDSAVITGKFTEAEVQALIDALRVGMIETPPVTQPGEADAAYPEEDSLGKGRLVIPAEFREGKADIAQAKAWYRACIRGSAMGEGDELVVQQREIVPGGRQVTVIFDPQTRGSGGLGWQFVFTPGPKGLTYVDRLVGSWRAAPLDSKGRPRIVQFWRDGGGQGAATLMTLTDSGFVTTAKADASGDDGAAPALKKNYQLLFEQPLSVETLETVFGEAKIELSGFDETLERYKRGWASQSAVPADSKYLKMPMAELTNVVANTGGLPHDIAEPLGAFLARTKPGDADRQALGKALLARIGELRKAGKWSVCAYQHSQFHALLQLGERWAVLQYMADEPACKTCCGNDALMLRVVAFGQPQDAWALLRHFEKSEAEGWLWYLNNCMMRLTGATQPPAGAVTNQSYDRAFMRQAVQAWAKYLTQRGIEPACSPTAQKLLASLPKEWQLVKYDHHPPMRWTTDPALKDSDFELLEFRHKTAEVGFPPDPATLVLWVAPIRYAGWAIAPAGKIAQEAQPAKLEWISKDHLLFTYKALSSEGNEWQPVVEAVKALGFEQAAADNMTPAMARKRTVTIALDAKRMASFGLTVKDVLNVLPKDGRITPAEAGKLGGVTIAKGNGTAVPLSNLAEITTGTFSPDSPPVPYSAVATAEGVELVLLVMNASVPATSP